MRKVLKNRITKKQLVNLGKQKAMRSAYDLSQLGMGFNQPCPRCGKAIDRRTSPYEPCGLKEYCRCK